MKTILITGCSGFVGSNLYDFLHQDFNLLGLDITKTGKIPAEHVFGWDQLKDLPEVDVIIHLAGKAHDTSNTIADKEYLEVNLGLTQKIYDHFLQSKAHKFIFFSSVKAVADSVEGVLTEAATPNPKTAYGRSKLDAEKYLMKNRENGGMEGWSNGGMEGWRNGGMEKELIRKQVYILRPCMIHGPGNKGNLNLLYKVVQKGIPWPLGAFDNLRSFASIENVAFVVRQIIEKPIVSGTYQLADDQPVSTNQLVRLIAKSFNRKPIIWKLPIGIIRLTANAGDLLHLPLNSERLKKLTESYVVSNIRLKTALSIERMPVTSEEGLLKTLKSFSDQ